MKKYVLWPEGWNRFYPCLDDNKDNPHYHHPDKGCECRKFMDRSRTKNWTKQVWGEYLYCETHGIVCSKTGWELGWYLGNNSREI